MPELRLDPLQRRWVIIATERGKRPNDFAQMPCKTAETFCPFCSGNEGKTPPEVHAVRDNGGLPNTPGWDLRVVPNKFPALRIEGDMDRQGDGIYDRMNGIGAHEVVIETPDHKGSMPGYADARMDRLLGAYLHRLRDLKRDERFRSILVFRNHGESAGASLAHPHTQIIATPITPQILMSELSHAREHYRIKERCLYCDLLAQELKDGRRIVVQNDAFVVFCPFASRFPFEMMLMPRRHAFDFAQIPSEWVRPLGQILREALARMAKLLGDPPYNYILQNAPNTEMKPRPADHWRTLEADFHWHLDIIPRLTQIAGFEWGTGFYINPTPPEDAARYLRDLVL